MGGRRTFPHILISPDLPFASPALFPFLNPDGVPDQGQQRDAAACKGEWLNSYFGDDFFGLRGFTGECGYQDSCKHNRSADKEI